MIVLCLLLIAGLGCKPSAQAERNRVSNVSTVSAKSEESYKLDEYTIKGFHFVYFRIPSNLDRQKLIEVAQHLHDSEPDAQLLLVDDDSRLKDYVAYAKASSGQGDIEKTELPKEWAEKHIVANVQKYVSGKFVLCEGNGYKEIADLE